MGLARYDASDCQPANASAPKEPPISRKMSGPDHRGKLRDSLQARPALFDYLTNMQLF